MKIKAGFWNLGLLLPVLIVSGCVPVAQPRRQVVIVEPERRGPPPWAPAHGWRRKHETYYYYPAIQVYYHPALREYYWIENGQWKIDIRLPRRYIVDKARMVSVDMDDEPWKYHHKIVVEYPPNYFDRGKGKEKKKKH